VRAVDFGTAPGGCVGSYTVSLTATGVAEMRSGLLPARLHAVVQGEKLQLASAAEAAGQGAVGLAVQSVD
jgi:uncharacterized membrane protein AbrB (regulator of aidB expression)